VAEAVPFGPVSGRIFPANRENNREFRENRFSGLILPLLYAASSAAWSKIPYRIEQGNFSAEQGMILE
jgi:hypothetical protein